MIDYDRLTLGGSRAYYVSFNNVKVGQVMGQGLVSCVAAWHISKPQVVVMHGAVTDNNATLFAQGYDSVINPYFKSGKWTAVAHTAGTWDPPTAETEFQAVFTAHHNVNSALDSERRDRRADHHVPAVAAREAQDVPDHGTGRHADRPRQRARRATSAARSTSRSTWRHSPPSRSPCTCGPARTPPASLANGKTQDTTANVSVPSVLLTPTWVTTEEHERHGRQGQLRAGIAALRRLVRVRLHSGGHLRVTGAGRHSRSG